MKTRRTVLMKAVSELRNTDYSREPELNSIYQRLSRSRKQFAEIFAKNIKAVMQISSLDLTMQHQTDKIIDIAHKVMKATETIFGGAVGHANNRHEELTNTIIRVSEETDNVYRQIEEGQNELTSIRALSEQTISISRQMKKDMDELINITSRISSVISGIDSISMQTNLLALNASVEAARAGEAGKGFSVVANEIRALAEDTQRLTKDMSAFVDGMKNASGQSVRSSVNTIESLSSMADKINNVWELNNGSKRSIANVNESVSSIAAVSEEISSAMTEMENQLKDCTEFMQQVGHDLQQAAKPVVDIEKILDTAVKQMGGMTEDAFFHLENEEFAEYMQNAISAHRSWLKNLRKMVDSRELRPLQLDSSKCGFGHFYYAMTPDIPDVLPLWEGLGEKHRKFHTYGAAVIHAIDSGDYTEAGRVYWEAEAYSRELISDMEKIAAFTKEH
ncbi:MAG: methyl-accepting chemotaxis protein [Blautia sp.]|nr:methyl-accepting chemotaxis protein [Blautia sp.]